jgi:anti-anti-sigma factor
LPASVNGTAPQETVLEDVQPVSQVDRHRSHGTMARKSTTGQSRRGRTVGDALPSPTVRQSSALTSWPTKRIGAGHSQRRLRLPLDPRPRSVIRIDRETDQITALFLEGEFDSSNVSSLRDEIETALASGRDLIVDLSQTTFIDSSVIRLLLNSARAARSCDQTIVLQLVLPLSSNGRWRSPGSRSCCLRLAIGTRPCGSFSTQPQPGRAATSFNHRSSGRAVCFSAALATQARAA